MDRHLGAGREVRRLLPQAHRTPGRCRHRHVEPRTARRPGREDRQHGDAHRRRGILPERMKPRPRHPGRTARPRRRLADRHRRHYLYGAPAAGNKPLGVVNTERNKNPLEKKLPGFIFGDADEDTVRSRTELAETTPRRPGQDERRRRPRRCRSAARPSPCAPRSACSKAAAARWCAASSAPTGRRRCWSACARCSSVPMRAKAPNAEFEGRRRRRRRQPESRHRAAGAHLPREPQLVLALRRPARLALRLQRNRRTGRHHARSWCPPAAAASCWCR